MSVGIKSNWDATNCYLNSAIQVLFCCVPFRRLVEITVNTDDVNKTLAVMKKLFAAMKIGRLVDLDKLQLTYSDLPWFKIAELGCAPVALLKIFNECFPVDNGDNLMKWFGGKTGEFVLLETLSEIARSETVLTPFIAFVAIGKDAALLQDLFDSAYSSVGKSIIDHIRIGDELKSGVFFDKIIDLPRVLIVEMTRSPSTIANGGDSDAFYSAVTYGMKLDVRKAMLDQTSPECSEYRLVSFIARQKIRGTGDDSDDGHYTAVCSSLRQGSVELEWARVDNAVVTKLRPSTQVLGFHGKGNDLPLDRSPRGKRQRHEMEYFVDCFQFVRSDYYREFYEGEW